MIYQEVVEKIHSIGKFGVEPSLERIELILNNLGNPQDKLKFVHIAGTNGKGTTASYIASCLKTAGYKTGLYTSPYVEKFTERFQINSSMISEKALVDIFEKVENASDCLEKFSQFEFITAMAMLWFAREKCDIVVLEVGLGGRFDATNVIKTPLLEIITSISLDHTAVLGNSVEEIAFEKAGIIKNNSQVVLYPIQEKSVFSVVEKICEQTNSSLTIPNCKVELIEENLSGSSFVFENKVFSIPFSGTHQIYNAITAYKAIEILQKKSFVLTDEQIQMGFKNTQIPARIELISQKPVVILDGGHNEGCSLALKNLLEQHLNNKKITAIIAMMSDKDSEIYLENLVPLFEKIVCVKLQNPRALSEKELAKKAKMHCFDVLVAENVEEALAKAKGFESLVVCGSLFLAGEIRKILLENQF